jgi:hypothetical protein
MRNIRLAVIDDPGPGADVVGGPPTDAPGLLIASKDGGLVLICGSCDWPLAVDVAPGQISIILRCPKCGSYNDSDQGTTVPEPDADG